MLYSIKMNPTTPAPPDAPSTDAAAASKVAASDANLPSKPVVKNAEETKAETKEGLLAVI